jgi:mannose-6-phosphate isomerase-like protein (cupin superfamily)
MSEAMETSAMHEDVPLVLDGIRGAMVQLGCESLGPMLSFFTERLGFRIDAIFPADDPKTALVSGHGIALQLSAGVPNAAPRLTLLCDDPARIAQGLRQLTAPNGTVVRFAEANPPYKLPPTVQALVISQAGESTHWTVGRAGLRYRDLLPQRHGGAFIASHIRILEGGPVPDYVHYHKVRFQMIFCRSGWVRVLYEGQGAPMALRAGDCVLQPPMIRHRVLESSAGAEVIEIGTPAEHITIAEHALTLPSADLPPDHEFGGQRFVRHTASMAPWLPWRLEGFEYQDTGIGGATSGLAGARVVRRMAGAEATSSPQQHDTEFCFYFVLAGKADFCHGDERLPLKADDSITVPGGLRYAFGNTSPDLTLLEVTLPDAVALTQAYLDHDGRTA